MTPTRCIGRDFDHANQYALKSKISTPLSPPVSSKEKKAWHLDRIESRVIPLPHLSAHYTKMSNDLRRRKESIVCQSIVKRLINVIVPSCFANEPAHTVVKINV